MARHTTHNRGLHASGCAVVRYCIHSSSLGRTGRDRFRYTTTNPIAISGPQSVTVSILCPITLRRLSNPTAHTDTVLHDTRNDSRRTTHRLGRPHISMHPHRLDAHDLAIERPSHHKRRRTGQPNFTAFLMTVPYYELPLSDTIQKRFVCNSSHYTSHPYCERRATRSRDTSKFQ